MRFDSLEKKEILIVGGIVVLAVVATAILVSVYWRIHGHGHIKTVGIEIYDGPNLVNKVSSVDFGTFGPGERSEVTLWIHNSGNTNVTLTLSTGNWVPASAQNYLPLSWNYTSGRWILPAETLAVKFSLYAAPTISGITDFSFDMIVTATG